eukprot:scaffold5454_cov94-Skeletonema_dohrnii-CCMP3373.AAC.1
MRCKEQKEGGPGVSLKRQHYYLLLYHTRIWIQKISKSNRWKRDEMRDENVTRTVTVGDVTHAEVILLTQYSPMKSIIKHRAKTKDPVGRRHWSSPLLSLY